MWVVENDECPQIAHRSSPVRCVMCAVFFFFFFLFFFFYNEGIVAPGPFD